MGKLVPHTEAAKKVTDKAVAIEEAASVHEEFGILGDFTLVGTALW